MMKTFLLFFALINFQLSAKRFSILLCYFMKREDKDDITSVNVKI